MLDQQSLNRSSPLPGEELCTTLREQIREAGELAEEVREVEKKYGPALKQEGLAEQMHALECWAECYKHGLTAAIPWLDEKLDERLKNAMEDIERLESEGGHCAGKSTQA